MLSFSETFYYIFPKFARKQFYHLILFLPHKIAPKKILHKRSISVQLLELLHPTHPLTIHKHFGSTYFPGVPKLVSPVREYNMNKDKNRVAQFYTKIDLSKLKSNFLVQCLISDGPRVHSLPFINIHKLLKNTNSLFLSFSLCLFLKYDYYGLCTSSIWSIRSKDFRFYRCTRY